MNFFVIILIHHHIKYKQQHNDDDEVCSMCFDEYISNEVIILPQCRQHMYQVSCL